MITCYYNIRFTYSTYAAGIFIMLNIVFLLLTFNVVNIKILKNKNNSN